MRQCCVRIYVTHAERSKLETPIRLESPISRKQMETLFSNDLATVDSLEAVRSAILATAWLLVSVSGGELRPLFATMF